MNDVEPSMEMTPDGSYRSGCAMLLRLRKYTINHLKPAVRDASLWFDLPLYRVAAYFQADSVVNCNSRKNVPANEHSKPSTLGQEAWSLPNDESVHRRRISRTRHANLSKYQPREDHVYLYERSDKHRGVPIARTSVLPLRPKPA